MLLKVDNLHARYGFFEVLRGISLEINEGEIVAFLGGNGAGKSTTINSISGCVEVHEGTIRFDGEDITKLSPHEIVRRGVVQVPEGRKLFPYMSVEENLIIGSYPKGRVRQKRKENLEKVYELFPKLAERRSQFAGSLSGGEQQMCAIGRGIMACPRLLMLDEPSLGLAPIVVEKIFETIVKIKQMGTTILLVEQNVLTSLEIADRGYVIEVGANALQGDSRDLMANEELRRVYLGM